MAVLLHQGLAVGLQEKEVDVWYLFGAICAHKLVIAFCMGLELLVAGTVVGLMVVYMVVFALVSPLGIAIGIIVTENITSSDGGHLVAVTILQGLAGGTILYVTFFEVSGREFLLRFLFPFCFVLDVSIEEKRFSWLRYKVLTERMATPLALMKSYSSAPVMFLFLPVLLSQYIRPF